jgi:hypothetical protein
MPKTYISVHKKRRVISRAQGRCEYCQSPAEYATETFAVEHITPISRGGTDELENLALACSGCNGHKYNKVEAADPVTGAMIPLFHPRRQKWVEHFGWSGDFTRIIGLTPIGRATIEAFQMNRRGLINIRKALYLLGKHPPQLE